MTSTLKAIGELALTVGFVAGWVLVNYVDALSPLVL